VSDNQIGNDGVLALLATVRKAGGFLSSIKRMDLRSNQYTLAANAALAGVIADGGLPWCSWLGGDQKGVFANGFGDDFGGPSIKMDSAKPDGIGEPVERALRQRAIKAGVLSQYDGKPAGNWDGR
jgi:hypothetical protein